MQLAAGPTEFKGSGIFVIHDDDGCSTSRCSQPAASDGGPLRRRRCSIRVGVPDVSREDRDADSRRPCGRMAGFGVVSYSSESRADAGCKGMDGEAAVVRE